MESIAFECAKCGKAGSGPGARLISTALSALVDAGAVPTNPSTVTEHAARVLTRLLDAYMAGNPEVEALLEAFRNKDDEVVEGLGILNRQAVWSVLSMLKKEKARRAQAHQTQSA